MPARQQVEYLHRKRAVGIGLAGVNNRRLCARTVDCAVDKHMGHTLADVAIAQFGLALHAYEVEPLVGNQAARGHIGCHLLAQLAGCKGLVMLDGAHAPGEPGRLMVDSLTGQRLGYINNLRLVKVLNVDAKEPLPLRRICSRGDDAQAAPAKETERLAAQGGAGAGRTQEGKERAARFRRAFIQHAQMRAADLVQRAAGA